MIGEASRFASLRFASCRSRLSRETPGARRLDRAGDGFGGASGAAPQRGSWGWEDLPAAALKQVAILETARK